MRNAEKAVYVALSILADGDGLAFTGDDRQLATLCGRDLGEIRPALDGLADSGAIRVLGPDADLPARHVVLLDHPEAERHIRRVLWGPRGPSDPLAWVEPEVLAWLAQGHGPRVISRLLEERLQREGTSARSKDRARLIAGDLIRAPSGPATA